MGPKPNVPKNDDLFRQRLEDLVNSTHPLVQLTRHIDWSAFEHEWVGFFPSHRGRPAIAPRLVAGLLYLQHTFALSDEEVVWRWVENPYWQLFCGETWFQHHPPIDPSSLTRWRQRIGAEGMQWLLAQTICAAASAKVIRWQSLNKVIVVNSDLKLIQFSIEQRFKTDTPPLRSHTTYAFDAVSRLLFTIPAAS
jgi:IS5 family transposase